MNAVAVVIALALLVTVASGLGYNSYNRYPSIKGNSLNTWGSRGGSLFDNGGWDLGHHGGYGRKYSYSFVLKWFCLKVDNIPIVFNIKIMTKYPTTY
jgi:hypothetical protein